MTLEGLVQPAGGDHKPGRAGSVADQEAPRKGVNQEGVTSPRGLTGILHARVRMASFRYRNKFRYAGCCEGPAGWPEIEPPVITTDSQKF